MVIGHPTHLGKPNNLISYLGGTKDKTLFVSAMLIIKGEKMEKEIVLIAKFIAKTGEENNVREALLSLVNPTRKEKGCILYNFHIETDNNNSFIFYEIWENKESFDLHSQINHFKNVMNEIKDLLDKPIEVIFLNKQ